MKSSFEEIERFKKSTMYMDFQEYMKEWEEVLLEQLRTPNSAVPKKFSDECLRGALMMIEECSDSFDMMLTEDKLDRFKEAVNGSPKRSPSGE